MVPISEAPTSDLRSLRLRLLLFKGANSTIICGNTIGRYAFVGAGSVVTKDVPNHALVVGNPGKWAGWMCQCGERLNNKLTCEVCGEKYKKTTKGLKLADGSPQEIADP